MTINLNADEKILLALRRHHLIFYSHLVQIFFLAAALFLGYVFLRSTAPEAVEGPIGNLLLLGVLFFLLFLVDFVFILWLDYYFDVWIVTNERIVDIELKGLFQREFSEFKLSRVQDVTVEVHGILPTFLDYGDVHIQTAGEARSFVFAQVPHPYKAKEVILAAHDEYMNEKLQHRHDAIESS